jgi:hypothetical protein
MGYPNFLCRLGSLFAEIHPRSNPTKDYEIRVFNEHGKTSLIFHKLHLNDRVAIQSAKEIAGDQAFDLWRGMDCIFAVQVVSNRTKQ